MLPDYGAAGIPSKCCKVSSDQKYVGRNRPCDATYTEKLPEEKLRADCKWVLPTWGTVGQAAEILEEENIRVLPKLL